MLIRNGYVLRDRVEKKDICIEGNMIADVGENLKGGDIIDASHHLVMPGFVNTHTHLAMTLLRGHADDVPLHRWLTFHIRPKEMRLTREDCYYGSLLGIIEMVKSGTTCFNDMYFNAGETARAVRESGVRAVLTLGLGSLSEYRGEEDMMVKCLESMRTVRDEPRITAAHVGTPDFLCKMPEPFSESPRRVHIHLHETQRDIKKFVKKHHKTPIEMLDAAGALHERVCAAHVVHVSEREMGILRKRKVKVLHCPSSNLKLASGIAPAARMVEKGICVSLGTDGAASNNTLDLVREMRLMTLLQKVNDAAAMKAAAAVKIATENGGTALGLNIGRIERGFLADLIFINLKTPSMVPPNDMVSNVVYAMNSSAVTRVIVDGRTIMEGGHLLTVDEEKVVEKAQAHASDLMNR